MPEPLEPRDANDQPIWNTPRVDSGSDNLFSDQDPGLLATALTPNAGDHEFATVARGQWSQVGRRFRQHKLAMVSAFVLLVVILLAFVGGPLWHYGITDQTNDFSQAPSLRHPFGTDSNGVDHLAQVLSGTRISLEIAFTVAVTATVVGTIYGAIAGYYRGVADSLMMRFVDLVLTIPILAVGALLGRHFGTPNWVLIAAILAGLSWTAVARVVRSQVLSLREKEYVEAARALGGSDRRIIFRHIVPNVAGPIIVLVTLLVASAILTESALSYLGWGIQPPNVSLGSLISSGETAASTRWWLFYFPGLFIVLIALTVNFIGDGLRDALDPTQTKVRS